MPPFTSFVDATRKNPGTFFEVSKDLVKGRLRKVGHDVLVAFKKLKPVAGARVRWTTEVRGPVNRAFVVLVFIQYENWVRDSNGKPMHLNSVRADLELLLSHLGYRHDDEQRTWYFLLDFDCLYTDPTGKTQVLPRVEPTKDAILNTLEIVGQNEESGLVYYGGHGERGPPGSGELVDSGDKLIYKEVVENGAGPVTTFLLSNDAKRISSEELFSRLPDSLPPQSVITICLDTCHAEGLLTSAVNLPHVYDGSREHRAPEVVGQAQKLSCQRVVITAAQVGEAAGAVFPSAYKPADVLHGILTWFMVSWVSKYPEATAANVARRLNYICGTYPENQQHPRIAARYPLTEPFQLLYETSRRSDGNARPNNQASQDNL